MVWMGARGDIVLDPFLGSGSTLIAADKTGRVCRGIELDPLYIDVILRRYEAAKGLPPGSRGDRRDLRGSGSSATGRGDGTLNFVSSRQIGLATSMVVAAQL